MSGNHLFLDTKQFGIDAKFVKWKWYFSIGAIILPNLVLATSGSAQLKVGPSQTLAEQGTSVSLARSDKYLVAVWISKITDRADSTSCIKATFLSETGRTSGSPFDIECDIGHGSAVAVASYASESLVVWSEGDDLVGVRLMPDRSIVPAFRIDIGFSPYHLRAIFDGKRYILVWSGVGTAKSLRVDIKGHLLDPRPQDLVPERSGGQISYTSITCQELECSILYQVFLGNSKTKIMGRNISDGKLSIGLDLEKSAFDLSTMNSPRGEPWALLNSYSEMVIVPISNAKEPIFSVSAESGEIIRDIVGRSTLLGSVVSWKNENGGLVLSYFAPGSKILKAERFRFSNEHSPAFIEMNETQILLVTSQRGKGAWPRLISRVLTLPGILPKHLPEKKRNYIAELSNISDSEDSKLTQVQRPFTSANKSMSHSCGQSDSANTWKPMGSFRLDSVARLGRSFPSFHEQGQDNPFETNWINGSLLAFDKKGSFIFDLCFRRWTAEKSSSKPTDTDELRLDVWHGAGDVFDRNARSIEKSFVGGWLKPIPYASRLHKFAQAKLSYDGIELRLPTENAPSPRNEYVVVRAGSKIVIWGGRDLRGLTPTGAWYDLKKRKWVVMPTENAPNPPNRIDIISVLGNRLVIWGRAEGGSIFDFETGRWSKVSEKNTPENPNLVVSNGKRILVINGSNLPNQVPSSFGAVFDPEKNTWLTMAGEGLSDAHPFKTKAWRLPDGRVLIAEMRGKPKIILVDLNSLTIKPIPMPDIRAEENIQINFTGSHIFVWGGHSKKMTSPGGGCEGPRDPNHPMCDPYPPSYVFTPNFDGFTYRLTN